MYKVERCTCLDRMRILSRLTIASEVPSFILFNCCANCSFFSATLLSKNSLHLSLLLLRDSATLRWVMHRAIPGRKECIPAMFPDQFVRKSGVADERHASRGDQRTSSHRFLLR